MHALAVLSLAIGGIHPAIAAQARQDHVAFPRIADWNSLVITLKRGPCFGACPVYTVEIRGDGRVSFEGREFVATRGRQESRISQRRVRALFEKFRTADFFSSLDAYRSRATDLPSFETSIAFDGHFKAMLDYGGGMVGMPKALSDLEREIDVAARTEKWIKPNGK